MTSGLALLLRALIACGRPPAEGEAHRYVQAAASGDPAACDALEDPMLRGECRVLLLPQVVARDGPAAGAALCEALQPGVWADECWFQLAEQVQAEGEEARALCARAGGFRVRCLGHVVNRLAEPLVGELPVGAEPAALAAVQELAEAYLGKRAGTAKARQVLRQVVVARAGAGDFDPAICGALDPALCEAAYRDLVIAAAGEGDEGHARIRAVCAGGAALERVRAAGLPGWTPQGEAKAQRGWQGLCRRVAVDAPPGR